MSDHNTSIMTIHATSVSVDYNTGYLTLNGVDDNGVARSFTYDMLMPSDRRLLNQQSEKTSEQ